MPARKPDEHQEIEIADKPITVLIGDCSADNVRVRAIDTTMRAYFRGSPGPFAARYLEQAGSGTTASDEVPLPQ